MLADDGAERAKYRTGGTTAGAVPSSVELAGFLRAALDRRLSFKLTAGLHHAVRGPLAEAEAQHGVLNVLAAVGAGVDGADAATMAGLLDPCSSTRCWACSTGSTSRRCAARSCRSAAAG